MAEKEGLGPNIELKDSTMTEEELKRKLETEEGVKEIMRSGADALGEFGMAAFVAKMMVSQSGLLRGMKRLKEDPYWYETAGVEQFRCSMYGFFIQIDDVEFFLLAMPHFMVPLQEELYDREALSTDKEKEAAANDE